MSSAPTALLGNRATSHTANGPSLSPLGSPKRTSSKLGASLPSVVSEALRSSGAPLEKTTSAELSAQLGAELREVRVHADSVAAEAARSLSANAFTRGQHIVFGRGRYAPSTGEGKRLLLHELAHVVQQSRDGDASSSSAAAPSVLRDAALESDADRIAQDVTCGRHAAVASKVPGSVQLSAPSGVIQLDQNSEAYDRGYRDGLSGAPALPGPISDEALIDYNEGYGKGRYESAPDAAPAITAAPRAPRVPAVNSGDGAQLLSVLIAIQTLEPIGSGIYNFTYEGKTVQISQTQRDELIARVTRLLLEGAYRAQEMAESARVRYELLKESDRKYPIISAGVQWIGGVSDPGPLVASHASNAIGKMVALRAALGSGDFVAAATALSSGEGEARQAHALVRQFADETQLAGEGTITALTITRDVSFGIAVAAGAVVAAPLIAGAGVGTLGTGALVTAGGGAAGGALRGGSSIVGQAIATGSLGDISGRQVLADTIEGAKRGVVDAGSTVTGLGVGRALGLAKPGLSLGQSMIGNSAAGAASGAFGEGAAAALDGNWSDVPGAMLRGTAAGALGGAATAGAGRLLPTSTIGRVTSGALGGGVAGGVSAGLRGDDPTLGILAGGVSGGAFAAASHAPSPPRSSSPPIKSIDAQAVLPALNEQLPYVKGLNYEPRINENAEPSATRLNVGVNDDVVLESFAKKSEPGRSAATTINDSRVVLVAQGEAASVDLPVGNDALLSSRDFACCAAVACRGVKRDGTQQLRLAHIEAGTENYRVVSPRPGVEGQTRYVIDYLEGLPENAKWQVIIAVSPESGVNTSAIEAAAAARGIPLHFEFWSTANQLYNVHATSQGITLQSVPRGASSPVTNLPDIAFPATPVFQPNDPQPLYWPKGVLLGSSDEMKRDE